MSSAISSMNCQISVLENQGLNSCCNSGWLNKNINALGKLIGPNKPNGRLANDIILGNQSWRKCNNEKIDCIYLQ